ncbi:sensor histidine kinase [Natronoarchaeum sp. GCM10025703]|uniref:sensor histidine kinase n=1 Tax=Natronoarchaeum sp. GCM10025703 TaxID=3252685 RepID=UPI00362013D0
MLRHNLRNDLTVIAGHAELIADSASDPALTDSAETIVDESSGLLTLSERARELNRTIDRSVETRKPIEFHEFVDDLISEWDDGSAEVSVAVSPGLTVRTDPDVLGLVIGNLLDNALDHSTDPSPTIELRARCRAADGSSLSIEIEDDGPGIPEEEIAVLHDGTEDALQHGSGIGLRVVQSGITAQVATSRFRLRIAGRLSPSGFPDSCARIRRPRENGCSRGTHNYVGQTAFNTQ